MSELWLKLKKSLPCKTHSSEVHDPKASRHQRKKQEDHVNCSNIKELIHDSMRCSEKQPSTPKSQASTAMLLNPVTHEIVLDSTSGEVKMCPCFPYPQNYSEDDKGVEGSNIHGSMKRTIPTMETHCVDCDECNIFSKPKVLAQKDSNDPPTLVRHHQCGQKQKTLDTIEELDISEHSGMDQSF
ncbi:hypothetical protein SESBI_07734 [Sesbania bispinosa]|nr:hypothetical protein SESBI_07734 [Sesbania bispinosa]